MKCRKKLYEKILENQLKTVLKILLEKIALQVYNENTLTYISYVTDRDSLEEKHKWIMRNLQKK